MKAQHLRKDLDPIPKPSELPTFRLTNHENEVEAVGKYHMLTTIVYQTPANDTK
jgi:hypothetical protein